MGLVNVIVIYESLTGNTRKVAGFIADELRASGAHVMAVSPTTAIDYAALSASELVIIGSWTDGLFIVGQRPGGSGRLRQLPFLTSKKAAVYCTYALDAGKVLEKLTAIVADRGATVVGGMTIRRSDLEGGASEFVERLVGAIPGLASAGK